MGNEQGLERAWTINLLGKWIWGEAMTKLGQLGPSFGTARQPLPTIADRGRCKRPGSFQHDIFADIVIRAIEQQRDKACTAPGYNG